MDITIKRLTPRYKLTIDDRHEYEVERIGRGRFTVAYLDTSVSRELASVFLVVNEDAGDYSKHILSNCDGPYIPQLDRIGDVQAGHTVWQTRYYRRLRATDTLAWKQFRAIAQCREVAWTEVMRASDTRKTPYYTLGNQVIHRTIEKFRDEYNYPELADALDQIADECDNYGSSYVFEFAARNLGVNNDGGLILLDPVFDLESMERMNQAAAKRQRRY